MTVADLDNSKNFYEKRGKKYDHMLYFSVALYNVRRHLSSNFSVLKWKNAGE